LSATGQSRLPISSAQVAEISFLLILIWLVSGPVSGFVLTTHTIISSIFSKSAYQVHSAGHLAKELLEASAKIKTLEKQLAESQLELGKAKRQAGDIEKLRALLSLRNHLELPTLAADVIARNPDNWFEQVTLDRGAKDHIKIGSAVITSSGIVGQIISVSENASVVRLLTDPDQKIGVIIPRINQPGVLTGHQKAPPSIDFIPVGTAVEVGDKVVALGNGGIFPSEHPIGQVAGVQRDKNGTTLSIEVKLSENLLDLTQVLIVPPQSL
jgi:rod shape-determining protein MreC